MTNNWETHHAKARKMLGYGPAPEDGAAADLTELQAAASVWLAGALLLIEEAERFPMILQATRLMADSPRPDPLDGIQAGADYVRAQALVDTAAVSLARLAALRPTNPRELHELAVVATVVNGKLIEVASPLSRALAALRAVEPWEKHLPRPGVSQARTVASVAVAELNRAAVEAGS